MKKKNLLCMILKLLVHLWYTFKEILWIHFSITLFCFLLLHRCISHSCWLVIHMKMLTNCSLRSAGNLTRSLQRQCRNSYLFFQTAKKSLVCMMSEAGWSPTWPKWLVIQEHNTSSVLWMIHVARFLGNTEDWRARTGSLSLGDSGNIHYMASQCTQRDVQLSLSQILQRFPWRDCCKRLMTRLFSSLMAAWVSGGSATSPALSKSGTMSGKERGTWLKRLSDQSLSFPSMTHDSWRQMKNWHAS